MLTLLIVGTIVFMIGIITWGITVFQINHNNRTDLLPLMWVFLAVMWLGTITINIGNVLMRR